MVFRSKVSYAFVPRHGVQEGVELPVVEEQQVRDVLEEINSCKSMGPDGLLSIFISILQEKERERTPVKMPRRPHWGDAVNTLEDRATVQRPLTS